MPGKPGIDFEGKQNCVKWKQVKQSLRHGPCARTNFNNNARPFQRKWSEHGLREITGAGNNRTNGTEVRYGLYGKRCQIHFCVTSP